jgi:general stress protein YciG
MSTAQELIARLIKLLRELQTRSGRRRIRARMQRAIRAKGQGRVSRRSMPRAGSQAGGGARAGGPAAHLTERLEWQPRNAAERLARRARRERAAGLTPERGPQTWPPDHRPSVGEAVRERYGEGFYSAIGSRGGSTVLEERGVEYLQDIGARGGAVTRQRYGPEHYAEIGRKGGLAGRGRKRPRRSAPDQVQLPPPFGTTQ